MNRPEQAAPQHHHPAAVLAVLFLSPASCASGVFRSGLAAVFSLVNVQLVGILLVVGRARKEAAELAPLQHQRRPAQIALLVRHLLHALDVFHVLAGVFELIFKVVVEAVQQVGPLLLAFFDVVQFLFEAAVYSVSKM